MDRIEQNVLPVTKTPITAKMEQKHWIRYTGPYECDLRKKARCVCILYLDIGPF